jgi:predicted ATPase
MIHLRSVQLRDVGAAQAHTFPFNVPAIMSLVGGELAFSSPVTFLVGENGSGKSTFLEALAYAAQAIAVGSDGMDHDPTLSAVRMLGRALKLSWQKRTRRGFFMRSEDFFGYAKRMQQTRAEMEHDLQAIDANPTLSPKAKALSRQPYARELGDLKQRYGDGLDAYSHGESFLRLFRSRFVPDGLYLLDEPEAPLSPKRQLALISLLKTLVAQQNAQFIIATHSPILMAFPGATIYTFDGGTINAAAYDELEHVAVTRDFLQHPQAFLQHL